MHGEKSNYLSYPIVIVTPDKEALCWLAELEKDFFFQVVSEIKEYQKLLTGQSNIAAVIFDQIDRASEFLTLTKIHSLRAKTFALVLPAQLDHLENIIPDDLSCQPLVKPCQSEILRLELVRSIEQQIWSREQELLLAVQRQESWFSLIGQLTREWAHEIRNRAAIISLNAEISMTKGRGQSLKSFNLAGIMEKIIEQCLKISKTLDSIRELSNIGQSRFPLVSLEQVIEQVLFLIKLEAPKVHIQVEKRGSVDLSLSLGESARLRSALLGTLRYVGSIKADLSPVLILIENQQGLCLKICIKDILPEAIVDLALIDGPLQDLLSADPKVLDFALGIRLLKAFGSEVSIHRDGSGGEMILMVTSPRR